MLEDELKEKEVTIIEILARINLQDAGVQERVSSKEYQSLLKKTFREWAGAESEYKRRMIRNILANASTSPVTSDDVLRLFIDWIKDYSELHFQVISAIYNIDGISRGEVWRKIGKGEVREDSADADLYKLLFRDLSTGSVIRQYRDVDYYGNFVTKPKKQMSKGSASTTMKSAFDEEEKYVLTNLGRQFVHYALTDLPPRIQYENPMRDV